MDYTYIKMKKSQGLLIALVIIAWIFILFWTFVLGLQKSFKPLPRSNRPNASKLLEQQRQKNRDIIDQQKRLTEERQQKLRDLQKR